MNSIREFADAMFRLARRFVTGRRTHVPERIYQARIAVCRRCPYLVWRARLPFCSRCHCCMAIKARLCDSACPLGGWRRY